MGHCPEDEEGPLLCAVVQGPMGHVGLISFCQHGTTGPWFWRWIVMRLLQTLTHLAAGQSPWVTMNCIRCISGRTAPLRLFDVSYTYDSSETASLN